MFDGIPVQHPTAQVGEIAQKCKTCGMQLGPFRKEYSRGVKQPNVRTIWPAIYCDIKCKAAYKRDPEGTGLWWKT